jgi:hypothetical protein
MSSFDGTWDAVNRSNVGSKSFLKWWVFPIEWEPSTIHKDRK